LNIFTILEQMNWRLRAFLGSPQINPALVGWRHDSRFCVVAEWLFFELCASDEYDPREWLFVDADAIVCAGQCIPTPMVLSLFIDLIDAAICSSDDLAARDGRVMDLEAARALLRAERQAALRLLPQEAASVARCSSHGCRKPAVSPEIYGFLDIDPYPHGIPRRASCRLFVGKLCQDHCQQVVVPPASWWPQEFDCEWLPRSAEPDVWESETDSGGTQQYDLDKAL
jgi:hypothetical protein